MRRVAAIALIALALVSGAGAARPSVPRFTHVVVVVFENKERGEIVSNAAAPTFAAPAARYASVTRYDAVTHPSLPNYLALVSGSTHGVTSDCTDIAAPTKHDRRLKNAHRHLLGLNPTRYSSPRATYSRFAARLRGRTYLLAYRRARRQRLAVTIAPLTDHERRGT